MKCYYCRKKYQIKEELNIFSCSHQYCNICLGRILLLNEFSGLKKGEMYINFNCVCNKGNLIKSTADYISLLNNILVNHENDFFEDSLSVNKVNEELISKLIAGVKKKKKNLKYKNFEEFSSYINTVESNLMNLFKEEMNNTLHIFDNLIIKLQKLKQNFIKNIDLKTTKLNSMFVILKMVYYNLYKDFETPHLSSIRNLKFLSKLNIEFEKIKFSPCINGLYIIEKEIEKFDNEKHFICDFIFSKNDKNIIEWKVKSVINQNLGIIPSIIQLNGTGFIASSSNEGKINIYDYKKKNKVFTLNYGKKTLVRKIIQLSNSDLLSLILNSIVIWNLKSKEIINVINENEGISILSVCEISNSGNIIYSNSNKEIKLKNLNNNNTILIIKDYICYNISIGRNVNIILGFENGEILVYSYHDLMNNNHNHIFSIKDNLINQVINIICEWKGKLIVGTSNPDIKIIDMKNSLIEKLNGHLKAVTSLFIYDYKTLVSSSIDSSIRMWDLPHQNCIYVIIDYNTNEWILSVIRMSNGQLCASGSTGIIKIWNFE